MDSLEVLAVAAHPDDVELNAGGTVCSLTRQGHTVRIVDLTRGELGTRGTASQRAKEAKKAAEIMGVSSRDNLEIPDGNIENSKENQLKLIQVVRRYRPSVVLLTSPVCRHPDHGAASRLGIDSMFFAGLANVKTEDAGSLQEPWRPHHILHYMQSIPFEPSLVVDVSDVWETRMAALMAFESQFHNPEYKEGSEEPETYISNPRYLASIEARARTYGYPIGATHGEPFLYHNGPIGTTNLAAMLSLEKNFR